MKTADLRIQAFEPGGKSRQMAAAVERAFCHFERFLGGLGEGLGLAVGPSFLRYRVKRGLGALDLSEGGNVLTRVERAFDQVAAHADQSSEQGQIVDLLCEVPRADHSRARSRQLRQICGAANLFYIFVDFEQWPQSYRVGDAVAVGDLQDRFVDAPMKRLEEVMRLELELDVLDQPVVDHQRAEQRRLGLDILREGLGARF